MILTSFDTIHNTSSTRWKALYNLMTDLVIEQRFQDIQIKLSGYEKLKSKFPLVGLKGAFIIVKSCLMFLSEFGLDYIIKQIDALMNSDLVIDGLLPNISGLHNPM